MPFQDRTGPEGQGPRTGRSAGKCGDGEGTAAPLAGRGLGRGLGRGRGRRGGGRGFGGRGFGGRGAGAGQEGSWISRRLDSLEKAISNLGSSDESEE